MTGRDESLVEKIWRSCVMENGLRVSSKVSRKVVAAEGGGLMNAGKERAARWTLSLSQVYDRLENAKLVARKSERRQG